ncbi:hypothetical protein [Saccharopolyspora sp. SCSIO 74807]|uniref:hypothetical protein n=1 Tax=Saccharopolyspora sp. SCSIO 74807 TaxID=3118084 RepID=UPI0030D3EC0A
MNELEAQALIIIEFLALLNMIPEAGMGAYVRFQLRDRLTIKLAWLALSLLPPAIYATAFGFISYSIMSKHDAGLNEKTIGLASLATVLTFIPPAIYFTKSADYARGIKNAAGSWEKWIGPLPDSFIELAARLELGKNALVCVCVASIQFALFNASAITAAEYAQPDTMNRFMDRLFHDYRSTFTICAIFLICTLIYRRYLNPSRVMAESSLSYFVLAQRTSLKSSTIHSLNVPRWRSRQHTNAFKLAKSLTRSVSGLKTKLTKQDFEQVSETARNLAHLIRKRSIGIVDGEPDPQYGEFCLAALSLAVSNNPVLACENAQELILHDDVVATSRYSRLAVALEIVDSAIQKYSRLLFVGLGLLVLALLLITGQFSQTLDFLRAIVVSGS